MTPTDPTRPRVLLLTHRLPYPPDRGDRIRAYHLLRGLAERCDVTLASVCEQAPLAEHLRVLRGQARDVLFQRIGPKEQRCRAAAALARGRPGTPGAHFHRALARRLASRHQAQPFDTVVTFCTGMASYTQALQAVDKAQGDSGVRYVLDLVDVDSAKWGRYAKATRAPMRQVYAAECRRLRRVECGGVARFDTVSVISQREARVYARTVSRDIVPIVAGNGVDTDYFSPGTVDVGGASSRACVFTGVLSYKPNADAVVWLVREVWPRVREAVAGARFDIVGKSPGPGVLALGQRPGVRVVGEVADTRPWLRGAAAAVAPLWIAPGVQNKVLEAMACAKPVVCTPAAARGIDARPGRDLWVAHDPQRFAHALITLLTDPPHATTMGQNARRSVMTHHDWSAALAPLIDTIATDPKTKRSASANLNTIPRPARAA